MTGNRTLTVLRVWVALAWADSLSLKEEQALTKLISATQVFSTDERQSALAILRDGAEAEPTIRAVSHLSLDLSTRQDIYRVSSLLAALEGAPSRAEHDFLRRLRSALKLPEEFEREVAAELS